ncbi:succinate dehydrogenase/fumarate reductase iron-sulfur subunit [Nautilia lithotrophica]
MKVNIKRYLNGKVWFDNFELDFKEDETILELLDRTKSIDRSITYRSFCRSSICGTCAVKVNDKTVLACKTKVKDFIEHDEIIIEPVDRLKVIKDLVVDHKGIEDKIKKTKSWFEPSGIDTQKPEELKKIEKQTDCILCMACFAECEALDYDKNFAGPFAFTKVFRFFFDSRDKLSQERIDTAKENGLFNCINCQKCVMVCPKGIASAFDIQMLQKSDINSCESQFMSENPIFF